MKQPANVVMFLSIVKESFIMLTVTLACFGAPKESYFRAALDEYEKRLSRFCRVKELCLKPENLPEEPNNAQIASALAAERARLEAALPKGAYRCALCIEGKEITSEGLSQKIEKIASGGKSEIVFIIGSSHGLDEGFKKTCDERLSLSQMTFAHSLALVMLAEQLYRAFSISSGGKYHK